MPGLLEPHGGLAVSARGLVNAHEGLVGGIAHLARSGVNGAAPFGESHAEQAELYVVRGLVFGVSFVLCPLKPLSVITLAVDERYLRPDGGYGVAVYIYRVLLATR